MTKLGVKSARKALGIFLVATLAVLEAQAGPREQAIRLHKILTGVQPSEAVITQMTTSIESDDIPAAARVAMENRYFWDVTLKNFAATWTNQNSSPVVSLNDAVATIIGIIKDNRPFTEVIGSDVIYTGAPGTFTTAYSKTPAEAIAHFQEVEASGQPLRTSLVRGVQSTLTGISDTSGIMTSQAWGDAFFKAGTNRRVWRFSMMNFMCTDLEGMMDTSVPGIRIRRDVDRAPGGEPKVFANKCIGCHATMDAADGATAYFDYTDDEGLLHTPGNVQPKVNRLGTTYPEGYVTTNDSWLFLGNLSANNGLAKLGWRGPASGNGLRSLGQSIAQSRGFSECMVKRVFQRVCLREATISDKALIGQLADGFEKDGSYNMLNLFAETSKHCLDEE
jgi:hypothetical protein